MLWSDWLLSLLVSDWSVAPPPGSSLKVIGTMSVGHDHIDMAEVKARGIKVSFVSSLTSVCPEKEKQSLSCGLREYK